MKKIAIIGTSGSGKTTLGHRLASITGYKLIDLDELFWLPKWKIRPQKEFIELVECELENDSWIISGNYEYCRAQVWTSADTILWLDYPFYIIFWRALKRSVVRLFTRKTCCNGNYETLIRLFSSQSILWWILKTYRMRKKVYGQYYKSKIFNMIKVKNQKDIEEIISNANS